MTTNETVSGNDVTSKTAPRENRLGSAAFSVGILLLLPLLSPCVILLRALARLVPKKKDLILLIPRFGGGLNGNLKYFYLYLATHHARDCEFYLLTHWRATARLLSEHGLPVLLHPSPRSIVKLLRARSVVLESTDWWRRLKSLFALYATTFQIWHGNGMKRVSMTNKKITAMLHNSKPFRWLLDWCNIYPTYDVVFFASRLQRERRGASFRMKEAALNGQPRNDVFFGTDVGSSLVGCDSATTEKIRAAAIAGKRVVLYSPTWRPPDEIQPTQVLDLDELNTFALRHNLLIVWKAHPKDSATAREHEVLIVMDKNADVYPIMGYADCMITDYSSIYMDYILLDRPIVFFPYDLEHYLWKRGVQHDYNAITPGPKCLTQAQMQQALREILIDGDDAWRNAREKVRRDFYEYQDGRSCERLFAEIRKRGRF
ncbi:MAG: CDP-glycerol glycerophosphotransferase family protein [bacterium]|uniref:CDP-glycerol glycerophosphotransferase family protein n=1 Tax=Candidatus Methylomirabilis tolerans TaxID=3123416 RepID=A0AAJ1AKH2_9BACT|nr:CDP-glycerol glycerophosphotransferase family protein [Candidatus Methylomirabilis sp.]